MARAHGFDGLVLVPNCDKIVPGMLMAAARLNIPSICRQRRADALGPAGHAPTFRFPRCSRRWGATRPASSAKTCWTITPKTPVPAAARCSGMYTANSMNCLSRSHWHGAARQRNHPCGIRGAHAAGKACRHDASWIWCGTGCVPRDILTPAAFRNALATDMALGCSSNSVLHLLAIANEADVPYEPGDFQ